MGVAFGFGQGRFLCAILRKLCCKNAKNRKNQKKCKKNKKKVRKNLHISKICCNFAPSFEKDTDTTPIINTKKENENEQNLFHKELW